MKIDDFVFATDIGLSGGGGRVGGVMNSKTVSMTVKAKRDDVFGFLAEVENLPLWAKDYCKAVSIEGDRTVIDTPMGRHFLVYDADEASGAIDMMAGESFEKMDTFPVRVHGLPEGYTSASFTFFQKEEVPDAMFEMQFASLVKEVTDLAEHFGGGQILAPQAKKRLYTGLVSKDLAATKAFYSDYFGFEAVFDAEFYLHLTHPKTGDEIGVMSMESPAVCSFAEFSEPISGNGLWFVFETDDVDGEYEALRTKGLEFVQGPTDQSWGERTCVVRDPNGVLVYLAQETGQIDEALKPYFKEGVGEMVGTG